MEGRAHPEAVATNDATTEALKPPRSPTSPTTTTTVPAEDVPEKAPETYIVQIPRDQIYRIPPPENSKIVESYRTLPGKKKKQCGCGRLIIGLIIFFFVVAIGCGITIALLKVLNKPIAPKYSITNIHIKNSTTHGSKHSNPTYEISLKAENTNKRISVSYEDGGEALISYKDEKIGKGKYPISSQDAKESTNVHLTLTGTKSTFPDKVEKRMKDKTPVDFWLEMRVPIKMKLIITFTKKLKVMCDFKVNTLGKGTKISSQDCVSEI